MNIDFLNIRMKRAFFSSISIQCTVVLLSIFVPGFGQLKAQNCTVNAGSNTTFCENETISLDGAVSALNGNPATILWTLISQPAGANIIIDNPYNPKSTTSGSQILGTYTFQLQQTCSDMVPATQQVTHTIAADPTQANLPTTTTFGCYDGSTSITITGNTPGSGETVEWKWVGGYKGILINTTSATVSFDPDLKVTDCVEGNYHTSKLQYTISNANCSTSDIITVQYYYEKNALYANAIPDNICGGTCTNLYAACALDGTGTWTASGPGAATFNDSNAPITRVCVDTEGTYTFTWTVTGGCRPGTDSDDVVFSGFGSGLTTTDAGPNQLFCEFPPSVSLNATPLEIGQTGLWTQLNGLPATITNDTNPSTTVTDIVPDGGPYVFAWEVFGSECSVFDTVQIKESPDFTGTVRNRCVSRMKQ